MAKPLVIEPQPGPQTEFFTSVADIVLVGGSAGVGKSWCLVNEPMRHSHVPGFSSITFRRTSPELTGPGSIWSLAKQTYSQFTGVKLREGNYLDARWPSGAEFVFAHLQHEDDVFSHQSKEYALVQFDELTHFTEQQFFYMMSRNRSTCGVKPYVRCATNPDPDSFVFHFVEWYLDEDGYPDPDKANAVRWFARMGDELVWGASPEELIVRNPGLRRRHLKSFSFIPGTLADNKILEEIDPGYRANLELLPRVERERLLKGNWRIRPSAGDYYKREWFPRLDKRPDPSEVLLWARAWDKASTAPRAGRRNPDWTVGVLFALLRDGTKVVCDVRRAQKDPGDVQIMMLETAMSDGPHVTQWLWQDPGQAGKNDVWHDKKLLRGFPTKSEVAKLSKEQYVIPVSADAKQGKIAYVRGPWNDQYFFELEQFSGRNSPGKKDQVDATSLGHMAISKSDFSGLSALATWRASGL